MPQSALAPGAALSVTVTSASASGTTQAAFVEVADAMGNTVTGVLIVATPADIQPTEGTFATVNAVTGSQPIIALPLPNRGGTAGVPVVTAATILTTPTDTTGTAVDLAWTQLDSPAMAPGASATVQMQAAALPVADVGQLNVTFTVAVA